MKNKISVLIADDNTQITDELSAYIAMQSDMSVAAVAADGGMAWAYCES